MVQLQHTVDVRQFQDYVLEVYQYAPGSAEAVPKHAHDTYQLCLNPDLASEYFYRGIYRSVPPKTLVVLHPGEIHSAQEVMERQRPTSFLTVYLNPAVLQAVVAESSTQFPFFPEPLIFEAELVGYYVQLCNVLRETVSQLEQDSLLMTLLNHLTQQHAETRPELSDLEPNRSTLQIVREYIDKRFADNVSLAQLAQIAGLSPYHLNRTFHQVFGLPPHQYQAQVRIIHARSLLLQGMPIRHVALATGYADQSHFTRQFKRLMQVTPGRYQPQNRKNLQDRPG